MPIDLRTLTRAPGLVMGLETIVVADPLELAETVASIGEQIESGGRRSCAWFESYMGRGTGGGRAGAIRVSEIGRTPTYLGRTCCYQHLTDLEHRLGNLRIPHETTCPECKRVFRIQWTVRARR